MDVAVDPHVSRWTGTSKVLPAITTVRSPSKAGAWVAITPGGAR